MTKFRRILDRSHDSLAEDMLGVAALTVILLGSLHLPGAF